MKKIFALALLLICLTVVPLATQAVPKPSGCVWVLSDSWQDCFGCVHEVYSYVCSGGGSLSVEYITCD